MVLKKPRQERNSYPQIDRSFPCRRPLKYVWLNQPDIIYVLTWRWTCAVCFTSAIPSCTVYEVFVCYDALQALNGSLANFCCVHFNTAVSPPHFSAHRHWMASLAFCLGQSFRILNSGDLCPTIWAEPGHFMPFLFIFRHSPLLSRQRQFSAASQGRIPFDIWNTLPSLT